MRNNENKQEIFSKLAWIINIYKYCVQSSICIFFSHFLISFFLWNHSLPTGLVKPKTRFCTCVDCIENRNAQVYEKKKSCQVESHTHTFSRSEGTSTTFIFQPLIFHRAAVDFQWLSDIFYIDRFAKAMIWHIKRHRSASFILNKASQFSYVSCSESS